MTFADTLYGCKPLKKNKRNSFTVTRRILSVIFLVLFPVNKHNYLLFFFFSVLYTYYPYKSWVLHGNCSLWPKLSFRLTWRKNMLLLKVAPEPDMMRVLWALSWVTQLVKCCKLCTLLGLCLEKIPWHWSFNILFQERWRW